MPSLVAFMGFHVIASWSASVIWRRNVLFVRLTSSLFISALFLTAMHGFSVLKILGLIGFNYGLVKSLKGLSIAPFIIWTYGITILFLNFAYNGYFFSSISSSIAWMVINLSYTGYVERIWNKMANNF